MPAIARPFSFLLHFSSSVRWASIALCSRQVQAGARLTVAGLAPIGAMQEGALRVLNAEGSGAGHGVWEGRGGVASDSAASREGL